MPRRFAIALTVALLAAGTVRGGSPASAQPNASFATGNPTATNNDDSCDISTLPAATLLLPYFEVNYKTPQTLAQTCVFTIVNVSQLPQIAHCTIWSDWAFPVLDFSIFLTGYDVQAINLYDIIGRGVIAPNNGTTNTITPGTLSAANNANPNFSGTAADSCRQLPGQIPAQILADIQNGLTNGSYSTCAAPAKLGGVHNNAIGYVTIDVASTCSTTLPTTSAYYSGEILFDNVLTGEYEQVNPNPATGNYAGGNPLVHIRAVPEGGPVGSIPGTNLPYTFYDRYTSQVAAGVPRTIDRRQPLPSSFATRYIEGQTAGLSTSYKIWREGVTGAGASCPAYATNSSFSVAEIVRFDEHEYPTTTADVIPGLLPSQLPLPAVSSVPTSSATFPVMASPSGDVAGWMYLNLNNGGSTAYSSARAGFATAEQGATTLLGPRQSQNWVVISMFAEGRYAVDFDAASLGNGCSPAPLQSRFQRIGPAGGALVCPPQVSCLPISAYPGTNVTP